MTDSSQDVAEMTARSRREDALEGKKDIDSGLARRHPGHEASLLSRPIVRDRSGPGLQAHKSLARFTLGTGDLAGFPRDSRDSYDAENSFISIVD